MVYSFLIFQMRAGPGHIYCSFSSELKELYYYWIGRAVFYYFWSTLELG